MNKFRRLACKNNENYREGVLLEGSVNSFGERVGFVRESGLSKHLSQLELLKYIDGELSQAASERVRQHISGCLQCESRMTELEITLSELITLQRIESSAAFEAHLKARIQPGKSAQANGTRSFAPARVLDVLKIHSSVIPIVIQ